MGIGAFYSNPRSEMPLSKLSSTQGPESCWDLQLSQARVRLPRPLVINQTEYALGMGFPKLLLFSLAIITFVINTYWNKTKPLPYPLPKLPSKYGFKTPKASLWLLYFSLACCRMANCTPRFSTVHLSYPSIFFLCCVLPLRLIRWLWSPCVTLNVKTWHEKGEKSQS